MVTSTPFTDGTLIRAEEGPKVLASPPTAYMAQAIYLVAIADYTLGLRASHCKKIVFLLVPLTQYGVKKSVHFLGGKFGQFI